VFGALLTYRSGPRCVVTETARYEVTDSAGHLLHVVNNPEVTQLHAVLGPNESGKDEEQPLYAWENWCNNAPQPPFVYKVVTQDKTAVRKMPYSEPGCADPAKPSDMHPFR
jgi:hypothetical protein